MCKRPEGRGNNSWKVFVLCQEFLPVVGSQQSHCRSFPAVPTGMPLLPTDSGCSTPGF